MALRSNNASENKQGGYANYLQALRNRPGFSLDAYRVANKARIFLESKSKSPIEIFSGFYIGNLKYQAQLEFGSFAAEVTEWMNNTLGIVNRSLLKSISGTISGESWGGAFDAPYKPFIKSSKPLTFDITCHLPLICGDKYDSNAPYKHHIQDPVNTLLKVVMPTKSRSFEELANKLSETVDSAIEWLFEGETGTFWECVQNAVKGLKKDFFGDIYMLNNPIQYHDGNEIVLRIGPWRVPNLMITNVAIDNAPLIYTDSKGKLYPSHCNVSISFLSKNKVSVGGDGVEDDVLNIGNDYNKAIDSY